MFQVLPAFSVVTIFCYENLQTLYDQGGRNFWVHNTGPLGCLPQKLSLVEKTSGDLDRHGCISRYNNAANLFNEGLRNLSQGLRSELKDATIVYVDIYAIKYDLIANSSKYGKLITITYYIIQLPAYYKLHLDFKMHKMFKVLYLLLSPASFD